MKAMLCCIRDTVVGSFNRPYVMHSEGQAIRSFTDEVNRPSDDNPMYKHPGDYDLYIIGEFDDEKGILIPFENPKLLINGRSVTLKTN